MYTTNLKHISSNNRKLLRNNQSKNMSIKDMQFLCEMLPGIILHAACIPQTLSIFSPNTRKYYTAINQASYQSTYVVFMSNVTIILIICLDIAILNSQYLELYRHHKLCKISCAHTTDLL